MKRYILIITVFEIFSLPGCKKLPDCTNFVYCNMEAFPGRKNLNTGYFEYSDTLKKTLGFDINSLANGWCGTGGADPTREECHGGGKFINKLILSETQVIFDSTIVIGLDTIPPGTNIKPYFIVDDNRYLMFDTINFKLPTTVKKPCKVSFKVPTSDNKTLMDTCNLYFIQ